MSEIDFHEAAMRLAQIIKSSDDTDELLGLKIQIFCDSINEGDTPSMALALAKVVHYEKQD